MVLPIAARSIRARVCWGTTRYVVARFDQLLQRRPRNGKDDYGKIGCTALRSVAKSADQGRTLTKSSIAALGADFPSYDPGTPNAVPEEEQDK
jgi:hypothetical protein